MKKYGYVFKVWISTIVVAPLLFSIFITLKLAIEENQLGVKGLAILILFIVYGAVLSLPTLAVAIVLFHFLRRTIHKTNRLKCSFAISSLILFFLTLGSYSRFNFTSDSGVERIVFWLSYIISIILFSTIYQVEPSNKSPTSAPKVNPH